MAMASSSREEKRISGASGPKVSSTASRCRYIGPGQHQRRHEAAAHGIRIARHQPGAVLERVVEMRRHLGGGGGIVDQRADGDSRREAVADLELGGGLGEAGGEAVVNAVLHQDAVGRRTQVWPALRNFEAITPAIAWSRSASSNTMNGAIAAEFQAQPLDGRGRLRSAAARRPSSR